MTSEEFKDEIVDVSGTKVIVTTYKIGEEFHCHVSNYDPGATISRAHGVTKEAAMDEAIRKASERILRYRRS